MTMKKASMTARPMAVVAHTRADVALGRQFDQALRSSSNTWAAPMIVATVRGRWELLTRDALLLLRPIENEGLSSPGHRREPPLSVSVRWGLDVIPARRS